ncbi:MAG: hypothetical protein ACC655_11150, partial [Rhodothermia bacterium]
MALVERLPLAKRKKRQTHRYSFPVQNSKIREEHKLCFGGGEIFKDDLGDVVAIDYSNRTIDIEKKMEFTEFYPTAVFEFSIVPGRAMEDAISALGNLVNQGGHRGAGGSWACDRSVVR